MIGYTGEVRFHSAAKRTSSSQKEAKEFRVDQVLQPFDGNKFNFTRVCQEELLFQFEADMPLDTDDSPSVVAINVRNFAKRMDFSVWVLSVIEFFFKRQGHGR